MVARRTRDIIITLLGSAALLAGCGSTAPSTGAAATAPDEVVVSLTGSYLTAYAPLWAAAPELAKVEEKYRTTISYSSFGKGRDALTALLGGSAQICNCAFTTALKGAVANQPVDYLANLFIGPGTVLIGAKKYESERGADLAAYAGGSFGYTSEGGTDQLSLAAAVTHAGLTWSDQKGVALGSIAAYLPALQSGRVDLAMMDANSAAEAIRSGAGYLILNTNDYAAFRPIGGTFVGNGLVFSHDFRTRYPELTQDLVTALVAGLNRVRTQSDAAAAYRLMPPEYQAAHADRSAFAAEWQLAQPSFAATDGSVSAAAVADGAAFALTPQERTSPRVAGFVDNSAVDRAYETLGLPRPIAAGS